MKVALLKDLRRQAHRKLGIFKFSDGKFYPVFDTSIYMPMLSDFDEKRWRSGMDNDYQVFEGYDTLEDAKVKCDCLRREYILRELRKMKGGNSNRYY